MVRRFSPPTFILPCCVLILFCCPVGGQLSEKPLVNLTGDEVIQLKEQDCPFSPWRGKPRYCFECHWCPFRRDTCCEMADERTLLENMKISGTDNWECFITLAHFQECGKCSPDSRKFLQQRALAYAPHPLNWSIRVCKKACSYIYDRCSTANLIRDFPNQTKEKMINKTLYPTWESWCAGSPDEWDMDQACYNSAKGILPAWACSALLVLLVLLLL